MISVALFYRTSAYRALSMDIYADNLRCGMRDIPGIEVIPYRPKEFRIPFAGKYLTQWAYYPFFASQRQKDINHICDFGLAHLMSVLDKNRTVITCHDLIGFEVFKSTVFWKRKTLLHYLFRNMLKAKKIIVDSRHTKEDILKRSCYNKADIIVVYCGVGGAFRRAEKDSIDRRFQFDKPAILHVGTDNYYKNVEGAIKAISGLGRKVKFIKVGPVSKKQSDLIKSLKIDFVNFPCLNEDELAQVYSSVDLLIFPSWHEGFGLPVIEAMACGCPVLCSNTASLPEVAGDAALMVSPEDVSGMSKAAEEILVNKGIRQELIEKGLIQAGKFSWEKAAGETADVYRSILN